MKCWLWKRIWDYNCDFYHRILTLTVVFPHSLFWFTSAHIPFRRSVFAHRSNVGITTTLFLLTRDIYTQPRFILKHDEVFPFFIGIFFLVRLCRSHSCYLVDGFLDILNSLSFLCNIIYCLNVICIHFDFLVQCNKLYSKCIHFKCIIQRTNECMSLCNTLDVHYYYQ